MELGLSAAERSKLQWAALIHDIGKITVPAEILNKKGAPTKREWEILRTHPANGEALAAPVAPWLGEWVHAVGGHHEKWDGTGYPRGLAGAAIPRAAAIVAVADSFEVMTAVRSYKKAMPLADARAELTRCAGTHFDPDIVRALLNVSIGRFRGAMGIFAGLAHVPFIGPLTTAAAHAPDTVTAAVGATTSGATAGLGMAAIGGAMVLGPTSPTGTMAAPVPVSVMSAQSVTTLLTADVVAAAVPEQAVETPAAPVAAVAVAVNRQSSSRSLAEAPTTTAAPAPEPAVEAVQAAEVVTEAASVKSDDDSKENREGRDEKARKELATRREAGSRPEGQGRQGSPGPRQPTRWRSSRRKEVEAWVAWKGRLGVSVAKPRAGALDRAHVGSGEPDQHHAVDAERVEPPLGVVSVFAQGVVPRDPYRCRPRSRATGVRRVARGEDAFEIGMIRSDVHAVRPSAG